MTALDQATQVVLRAHMATHLASKGIIFAATHGDLGFTPDHVITMGDA